MRWFWFTLSLFLSGMTASCSGSLPFATATPAPPLTATPTATPLPEYAAIPKIYFGAFGAAGDMQKMLGHKFTAQLYYHAWQMPFGAQTFTVNASNGWITMPTWEYTPAFNAGDANLLHPLQAIWMVNMTTTFADLRVTPLRLSVRCCCVGATK